MYFVFDIETTGLDRWRNEIITLAYLVLDERLELVKESLLSFRPEEMQTWSEDAQRVHGITPRKASMYPERLHSLGELTSTLMELSPDGGYSAVCHALPMGSRCNLFDVGFLFSEFFKHDQRCTFYHLFPEEKFISTIFRGKKEALNIFGIPNQKLDTWANKLNIKFSHHNALDDARVCAEVFKYQAARGHHAREGHRKSDTSIFGGA